MCDNNGRSGSTSGDTMATRLPEVVRALRQEGVHHVIASYGGSRIAVAYLGHDHKLLAIRPNESHILHIVEVFRSVLKRRYPAAFENAGETGIFEWDLINDSLEHQHTITHRGL